MLGSESALLKAGVHPGNKLLALIVQTVAGSQLSRVAAWAVIAAGTGGLHISATVSLQSKRCTLISPCPDQGTLCAPKGRRCSHLVLLQHCEGATTLETICSLHMLNAEQERWASVSM